MLSTILRNRYSYQGEIVLKSGWVRPLEVTTFRLSIRRYGRRKLRGCEKLSMVRLLLLVIEADTILYI